MFGRHIYSVLLLLLLVAIYLPGRLMTATQPAPAWALTVLLMTCFVTVAGKQATRVLDVGGSETTPGVWRGALIDERNKISLSRLQMIAWTIVVLSAYLTAVLQRVQLGEPDALAVAIPVQLWVLMGISTASLVGSPLITGQKMNTEPRTNAGLELKSMDSHVVGVVTTNEDPEAASWADVFRQEEVLGRGNLDLGKIQMFFFTAIILLAYGTQLWSHFSLGTGAITALPAVPEGMNALLGISHAGYLTNKAIPKS